MCEKSEKPSFKKPIINLQGLRKSFGRKVVLDGINLQVTEKQALCICGANAAGKTTLLRIITGLLQPDDGKVQICGFETATHSSKTKGIIGAIFHKPMVYPQLTVEQNLRFFAKLYALEDGHSRIEQLTEQMALTAYRYDSAGILSRGIMRRLAIARALIHKPTILIADEPFAGLDQQACKQLTAILRDFTDQGGTVLMTTHNADFALKCCEKVAVLDQKKLIFKANVAEINTVEFSRDYLAYAKEKSDISPARRQASSSTPSRPLPAEAGQLKNSFNIIRAIFTKDLLSEFRTKQLLPTIIVFGLLIAWVFHIATAATIADKAAPAAAVILVALLFSVILASQRSFAVEYENDCISSLLLATADAGDIYIGKLLVNIVMLCIFEVVAAPAVLALFGVNPAGRWVELICVLVLINVGFSSIATLLGCAVQTTKPTSSLLSILVTAALLPMMIPAIFALLLLFGAIGTQVVGISELALVGDFKRAVGFLVAFDAIFVTLCWLLFNVVVKQS